MKYSYYEKQIIQDKIYRSRLLLIEKIDFDYNLTSKRYAYFMKAFLGRIL